MTMYLAEERVATGRWEAYIMRLDVEESQGAMRRSFIHKAFL